jgi:hypothetical protein
MCPEGMRKKMKNEMDSGRVLKAPEGFLNREAIQTVVHESKQ